MNKRKILLEMAEMLREYLEKGLLFHKKFAEELKEALVNASGSEGRIFNMLGRQLSYVATLGRNVNKADGNEIIKYQKRRYYSLHIQGNNFNIRLLMTFNKNDVPLFLACFYEREGKSHSDYSQWTSVLDARYEEICEEE